MTISFRFKKLIIATAVLAMVVVVFLVYALAGLSANPVIFADPPAFVERYAAEMDHSDLSSQSTELETDGAQLATSKFPKLTADFSVEEALVFNVMMAGESSDVLMRLFAHPDKAQREKMASAFATVIVKFTHNEETGFAAKKRQFWTDAKDNLPDLQNALSEALITSAEQGKTNRIPYTLAWMPGQGRETVELFVWAAKHHPDPWVRLSSVYYVVKLGGNEDIAAPLLRDLTDDPVYRVRKEALDLRFRRFTGEL